MKPSSHRPGGEAGRAKAERGRRLQRGHRAETWRRSQPAPLRAPASPDGLDPPCSAGSFLSRSPSIALPSLTLAFNMSDKQLPFHTEKADDVKSALMGDSSEPVNVVNVAPPPKKLWPGQCSTTTASASDTAADLSTPWACRLHHHDLDCAEQFSHHAESVTARTRPASARPVTEADIPPSPADAYLLRTLKFS